MKILRYISILPGSLLAIFVGTFVIRIAVMLIAYFGDSSEGPPSNTLFGLLALIDIDKLEYYLNGLFLPIIGMAIAIKIAPNYKITAAISVGIVWVLIWAGMIIAISSNIPEGWSSIRVTVTLLLSLVGGTIYLISTFKQKFKDESEETS